MKLTRRILAIIMVVAMVLGMTSCGGGKSEEKESEPVSYTESKDLFHIADKRSGSIYYVTKDMDEITLNLDKVVMDANDVEFTYKWMNMDGEEIGGDEETCTVALDHKGYGEIAKCEITGISDDKKQVSTETFSIALTETVDLETYITSGANAPGPAAYGLPVEEVEYFSYNFALGETGKYKLTYTLSADDVKLQMAEEFISLEPLNKNGEYELKEGVNYSIMVNSQGARGVKLEKVD